MIGREPLAGKRRGSLEGPLRGPLCGPMRGPLLARLRARLRWVVSDLRWVAQLYADRQSGARTRVALTLFALALGVGLALAIHLVNRAALNEFTVGLRSLSGGADLSIVGPQSGFAPEVYARIAQLPTVAAASPLVELSLRLVEKRPNDKPLNLRVLGLDPFRAVAVQPGLIPVPATRGTGATSAAGGTGGPNGPSGASGALGLLNPQAIFLAQPTLDSLGLAVGDRLAVYVGAAARSLDIAGVLPADIRRPAVAVMDIAAVHDLVHAVGADATISRVDVRARPGADPVVLQAQIQALLPPGVRAELARDAGTAEASLTRAYRTNLTVLALVAILTGGLLVFTTEGLAVARRRGELALWRALGVARWALMRRLLFEAACIGALGALLGLALGYSLAGFMLTYFGGDLGAGFFRGLQPTLIWDFPASVALFALGVASALAGAAIPAWRAASEPVAQGLRAADAEGVLAAATSPWFGVATIGLGGLLAFLPAIDDLPIFGYAAVACVLIGVIVMVPWLAAIAFSLGHRLIHRLSHRLRPGARTPHGGVAVELALAQLAGAPRQPASGLAAIVAAVSLAVAMAIMVESFRVSLEGWLDRLLPADLYTRTRGDSAAIDPALQTAIRAVPGVARAEFLRADQILLMPGRPLVVLLARDIDPNNPGARLPLVRVARAGLIPPSNVIPVWISEAVAERYGYGAGESFTLPLVGSVVPVFVQGIWRDYARQQGAIVMERARYRTLTGDDRASDAAIWLQREGVPELASTELASKLAPNANRELTGLAAVRVRIDAIAPNLELASPGEIRRVSMSIFDRTFAVTYALEAAAIVIGLAGLAASFAAATLAREREFGVLRYLGMPRRQIAQLLATQGALVASIAALVGALSGVAVSLVLIHVVNRQSFHWGMDFHLPWGGIALFIAALVACASVTAIVAGRRAMSRAVVAAVKADW